LRVGVVWRSDTETRATARGDNSRLAAIFAALSGQGFAPEPLIYDEAFSDAFLSRALTLDAVLVWVDPISGGRRRHGLDDLLRQVAAAGVFVSAHPDVIDRMGVKAVLHRTRSLGWGSDVHLYETFDAFERALPESLASGPRVLKQNRGNGGIGVWRIERLSGGEVHVRDARGETGERTMPLPAFLAERAVDFDAGGGLIDQPFQSRLTDGMVRCYMAGDRVAGFGHQMVRALAAPDEGPAGPRVYSGPDDPRFQRLRVLMEREWAPGLCETLGFPRDRLPVIWDADFLLGPWEADGADSYVLCEINCSSVFPIPDEAPAALTVALAERVGP
jgi:hypothetical protein